ncbi:MAG: hypothetical protein ACP5IE_04325 [Infirmifilum sp.]
MEVKRPVLLTIIAGIILAGVIYYIYTSSFEDAKVLLSHAKSSILSWKGWGFEERINCSDTYVFVKGNVSLATHEISTSISVVPKQGSPEAYLFYSNKSTSLVNLEGAWISRGRGWDVEDLLVLRLLDVAMNSTEIYIRGVPEGKVILFNSTCGKTCLDVFTLTAALTETKISSPSVVSGRIKLTLNGQPESLVVVFKGEKGVCRLEYDLIPYNEQPLIIKP